MTALRSIGRGRYAGESPRVGVINYGMGNLLSVCNALQFLGYAPDIICDAQKIAIADAFILPGVGAFGEAMNNLTTAGLTDELTEQVIGRGKPFLGICLGMQLIARSSTELGDHTGLGWIDGGVVALPESASCRVPHVGWEAINLTAADEPLFGSLSGGECFFFDHSFHLECDAAYVTAMCAQGEGFVAAVRRGNIHATQFHPERSQRAGLGLLRNFLNECEEWCGNEAVVAPKAC